VKPALKESRLVMIQLEPRTQRKNKKEGNETINNKTRPGKTIANGGRNEHLLAGLMEACFGLEEPHDSSCA